VIGNKKVMLFGSINFGWIGFFNRRERRERRGRERL